MTKPDTAAAPHALRGLDHLVIAVNELASTVAAYREAGFTVTVTEGPVNPLKVRLGVPTGDPLVDSDTAAATNSVALGTQL